MLEDSPPDAANFGTDPVESATITGCGPAA
jgi:hypothetical protein